MADSDGDQPLFCFVEIPKGSRNKYEYDEETDAIMLDRFLFSSMVYPTDYGFIPKTHAEDGDPLDAMVCVSEPTFPGCMIPVKPIALFRMEDDKGVDDKVLCVPLSDPAWNTLEELDDLPEQLQQEIEHFFSVYKDLEQKKVTVHGWRSRDEAVEEIERSRKRYDDRGQQQDAEAKQQGDGRAETSSGQAEEPAATEGS
jgi:inorganic pyrophosphatase